ncbi:alpha/beta fold hydrolase [Vagococcus vulneris]|uniref:AB hydrolase-1 domain-containing protein n=1 Tax=Vagococcus vulneris TaxID=1977869 RepID=A0A430A0W1_9ENTE|nr:alpha/beta hydrolase [Vagococcus vulneris]RSU00045.1 hypothetical protein CBF37_01715 [Vagococcus vulneris]
MSEKLVSSYDGTHIYYKIIGEGEPLLFIHGNSNSHKYFYRQLKFFKKKYQLILMDTRDHGHSSNNASDLNYNDIMQDIVAIMDNEAFDQLSVIGFSDGANIGLAFGAQFPERCNKLILVSPNMTYNQLKRTQQWFIEGAYALTKYLLHMKKRARVIYLTMLDVPITQKQREEWEIPTLVIIADNDITTTASMIAYVEPINNMALKIIKNSLHSIPMLRPNTFNRLAFDFLEK